VSTINIQKYAKIAEGLNFASTIRKKHTVKNAIRQCAMYV